MTKRQKTSTGCRKGAGLIIPVSKGNRGNKKKKVQNKNLGEKRSPRVLANLQSFYEVHR
jgi:hypothetical protein